MARVLLVDDSRTVNAVISEMLSQIGLDVQSAFDGEEAIDCIKAEQYDVVITDLIMPGLDGVALINYICRSLDDTTPKILAMSGGSKDTVDGATALDCVKHLVDRVMVKPFSKDELLDNLKGIGTV
ncbi:response regulator [Alphaproteobacteria bacterium]|nr:response regulator [Alphaproteobacteria bacterium]